MSIKLPEGALEANIVEAVGVEEAVAHMKKKPKCLYAKISEYVFCGRTTFVYHPHTFLAQQSIRKHPFRLACPDIMGMEPKSRGYENYGEFAAEAKRDPGTAFVAKYFHVDRKMFGLAQSNPNALITLAPDWHLIAEDFGDDLIGESAVLPGMSRRDLK